MKCLTSLVFLGFLSFLAIYSSGNVELLSPKSSVFTSDAAKGIAQNDEDVFRFNVREENYLDLTALEAASVVLSRMRCQFSEALQNNSIETILVLLNSGETTDFNSAIAFLKARFVDLPEKDKNLQLVSSVYNVLLSRDYADSKHFLWGISAAQELVVHKEGESSALILSPYEQTIIEINHEIPAFWANIELHKDAGPEHTKIQVLNLLTANIDETIRKLSDRTLALPVFENALVKLQIMKSGDE